MVYLEDQVVREWRRRQHQTRALDPTYELPLLRVLGWKCTPFILAINNSTHYIKYNMYEQSRVAYRGA